MPTGNYFLGSPLDGHSRSVQNDAKLRTRDRRGRIDDYDEVIVVVVVDGRGNFGFESK